MGKRQDTAPDVERESDGKWLPGQSPNPGGMPKWVKTFRDAMRDRCAPLAERHLYRVLGGQEAGRDDSDPVYQGLTADDRTKAAKVVLELVLPKPKQSVRLSGDKKNPVAPLAGLTVDQLLALATGQKPEGT
jgi:hypothetical protein